MKIALCQMANAGKPAANLEKSIRAIKEAAENGADLILFPEVQLTEFFPQYPGQDVTQYRISLDSEVVTAFCRAAQENGILVVPNILLYENGRTYDASLLIQKDGTIAGVQKMVHIAQAEQFYEQDYYTPSDDGFHVFDTEYGGNRDCGLLRPALPRKHPHGKSDGGGADSDSDGEYENRAFRNV